MARWRLTEPHYINVPGTRWEYIEVDRVTGRPKRTQFDVPRYLDPRDPRDWTVRRNNDDGDIIVSNGNNPGPGDIVFIGDPSTGMFPLDDEARELSSRFDWKPTVSLAVDDQADSYTQQLLNGLIKDMANLQASATAQASPRIEGIDELLSAMTGMMKQNQEIIGKLADRRKV